MSQHLEVVENEEGEILLRRADAPASDPLVALRFSPEVRTLLGAHLGEVAMAMLGAGMQASQRLVLARAEEAPPRLH